MVNVKVVTVVEKVEAGDKSDAYKYKLVVDLPDSSRKVVNIWDNKKTEIKEGSTVNIEPSRSMYEKGFFTLKVTNGISQSINK